MLKPGTKLKHYEVVTSLGAGGMGEVYRARDTKLNRDVAIKVLPEDVANDEARLARFRREAQVLASLNHPNIAAIYGLEESDGVAALALELVEGEDLAERLKRGAIPYEETMAVAREIAAGLEAAHEKGVVHRDLKPANIKLGAGGEVKILDFGLAKAFEAEPASSGELSQSPTISRQMTEAGVILGTAAYMSPEQAKGKPVDKRTDIWAFGVVLYEMLTGRSLFAGEDLTETLASVVKDQPDLNAVPREVRRLLAKCLERDPKRRLRDIGDAWELLDTVESVSAPPSRLPWVVAGVATLAAVIAFWSFPGSHEHDPIRFHIEWPESQLGDALFQLSPDGRNLVMVDGNQLWVRPLDAFEASPIEGTDRASYPFWSPDGSWIGFFADRQLKKVSLTTGLVQTLCDAVEGRGATWSPNGTILLSRDQGAEGIVRVSDQGGEAETVTTLASDVGGDAHRYPQFLPDGERFLFLYVSNDPDLAGVYVGTLDGAPPVRVLEGNDRASYAPPAVIGESGFLVFRRQESLMAQPFDIANLHTVGAVFPIADGVSNAGNTGYGSFSIASNGTLAHSRRGEIVELVWLDRSGKRLELASPAANVRWFSLSPDERKVALVIQDQQGSADVWIQDLPGGTPSRFTFGPSPGWGSAELSPDGSEVAYTNMPYFGQTEYEIRRKRTDMSGGEQVALRSDEPLGIYDWSPDGKQILYGERTIELWLKRLDGDEPPIALSEGAGGQTLGQFSPDGGWIAYVSNVHGANQVYVEPYPASGALWQVSSDGGSMPRWRADGRELFYRAADGKLMAVAVSRGSADSFEHGTPEPLFESAVPVRSHTRNFAYQPSKDGQRFLVALPAAGARPPISVVLNWQAAVEIP